MIFGMLQIIAFPMTGIPEADMVIQNPLFSRAVVGLFWLIVVWMIFLMIRGGFRKKYQTGVGFKKIVLLVMVPKESSEKGESGFQEKSLQEIQEDIAVAENIFASIGGLRAERGLKAWFLGREDTVSFEIVAKEGLVSFYVAAPGSLKDFIEQQIHAQYPLAQIEETDDYNIFSPQGVVTGTTVGFSREHYFPIK